MSDSLGPHGLQPIRLLRPRDFPGKSAGVDCHFLLQGNLPDPGIEPGSPALQADALPPEPPGTLPLYSIHFLKRTTYVITWMEKVEMKNPLPSSYTITDTKHKVAMKQDTVLLVLSISPDTIPGSASGKPKRDERVGFHGTWYRKTHSPQRLELSDTELVHQLPIFFILL